MCTNVIFLFLFGFSLKIFPRLNTVDLAVLIFTRAIVETSLTRTITENTLVRGNALLLLGLFGGV